MFKLSSEEISWLRIPARVSALEVAKNLKLPTRGNVMGQVDLELTPYLKTPISLIGISKVNWVFIIAPTQSGKTVFLQVAVADAITQDPGPFLYLLPDENMGRKHLKEKVIRVIEENPSLMEHATGKCKDISKQGIELENMTIYPAWAGSPSTMSSFPQKRVAIDEARLMKLTIGSESNALQQAADRLTTYLQYGIGQGYTVSSPSVKGDLLHQQLDVYGTQVFVWKVQCQSCGEYQQLDFFRNIKLDKAKEEALCRCAICDAVFDGSDQKRGVNATGKYYLATQNEDGEWVGTDRSEDQTEFGTRAVFWWTSLDSPFRSYHAIFRKFLETKDKLHDYRGFCQTWLARFFDDDISNTSIIKLKERKDHSLSKGDVPTWTKILIGGIDTQDDGFYVTVRAFGPNKRTHLVDAFFINCSIDVAEENEIIRLISRDIMTKHYTDESGALWQCGLVGIDTGGHRTSTIYKVATAFHNLILVKGKNNQAKTISYNKDINLYLVRTCEYLDETEIRCESDLWTVPNNIQDDYLTQFVNIRKVKERNKRTGEEKVIWKKVGRCDYRFADVHTFICLDIDTEWGKLRSRINDPDFKFNPVERKEVTKVSNKSSAERSNSEEQNSSYDYGGFDW